MKIQKSLLFLMFLINLYIIPMLCMMERKDMPFLPLQPGKISKEQNEQKITYTKDTNKFRHTVEYDKKNDTYTGYSHHIPSRRVNKMVNPKEIFQNYEKMHNEQN